MKKSILYSVLMAVVAVLSMSSCSDFLDASNKSNISADSYFTTESGLQALRIAAYDEFTSIVPQTDIYECGTDLYMNVRSKEESVFTLYTMTPETSDVSSFYSNAYDLINHANCCIKYGEKNAQVTAEAIFMRCYGYYLLTQMFGAVPYVTWYIEDANREYPRTPLDEIYPALIEDLEGIMNDSSLPANSINTYGNSGYISQRAVKALLARICLAAGWDLTTTLTNASTGDFTQASSTTYFDKAAQYAVAAIDGQSLTMSFEDKWSALNEDNAEEIFSIQYDRANYPGDESSGGHSLENSYGGYMGDQTVTGLKQVGSNLALSDKAVYLWDEGDERWDGSFMNTIYNYDGTWGTTGYFAYYNVADKSNLPIALRFFPWYESQDDAEAELAAHKAQYIQGDNVVVPQAFILGSTTVKYTFDDTGAVASKDATLGYDYYTTVQYFPTVLKKYDDANTSQTTSKNNDYRDVVVFHLSEMYLVAAEAYLMAGNTSQALSYLNAVRTRAGAPSIGDFSTYESQFVNYTYPSTFGSFKNIDVILDESAREMFGERVRWMDLRRTRQLVRYNVAFNSNISSVSDMSNMAGEVKWYRPIPASEISSNESMTDADQNPGY